MRQNPFFYFKKFAKAKEKSGLNIYPHEDIKIAMVYKQMGLDEQATHYFKTYSAYCEMDQSIYKSASMAVKHAYEGNYDEAIKQLKIFATQDNYQYWILIFMKLDPILKPLKTHPEFEEVIQKIENRFWENQRELKKELEEKALI